MARNRVVAASTGNPLLTQFVSAVNRANLASTLNNAHGITVFAPTNAAFQKLGTSQLNSLLNNPTQLKKVLNFHVVNQRITPAELPNGSFVTREGARITTSGSGTSFTVNGTANIVCGNIRTVNATIYLIDSVLMPPS